MDESSIDAEVAAAEAELAAAQEKLNAARARQASFHSVPGQEAQAAAGAWAGASVSAQPGASQAGASQPAASQPAADYQQAYGSYQQGYSQQTGYNAQNSYNQGYSQPGYADTTAPASKDHVAAGLLAIFLGSLGIHKFYLGYNTQGFIMLAVTILGSLITLGLAALVMEVIAFIEGVIYLTKSQTEFEQLYVFNQKPWF